MNLAQQIGGQQPMANAMFPGDRAPQRHVEVYQQVMEPNPHIGRMPMPHYKKCVGL
jgi:hypothetical protein